MAPKARKSKPSKSTADTVDPRLSSESSTHITNATPLQRPTKPLPSRQRPTGTQAKESIADLELNVPKTDTKSTEAVKRPKCPLPTRTRLSRKDTSAKEDLLKQIHVALILDQVERVYCVPCEAGIEVFRFGEHEEEKGHQNCLLEWKSKCLHFAEKMNYKYLRTDTVSGDGKLAESKMIYEPIKPELDLKEFVTAEETINLRLKLQKLDKPQAKEEVDRIDAIRLAFEEERLKKIRKQEADTLKRLKSELLERSDVALILNKSDLVYCIPCKEAVDVLKHDMHEEEEEHKSLSLEWKRKCLHFAEKMNYRCLRKGDVREDGEVVKLSVVYEAVRPEPTEDFGISHSTLAFTAMMEAEQNKAVKGEPSESPKLQPDVQYLDWTDPVGDDELSEDLIIGV